MKKLCMLMAMLMLSMTLCTAFAVGVSAASEGYYTYTVSGSKATITAVNFAIQGNVTVPATLGGAPVTAIGPESFKNCTKLTSVTIPDSVTSIGKEAFNGCTALTTVSLGAGVKEIGDSAFFGCTKLASITIPDTVTTIGQYAFFNCTSLTEATIGSGVTSIGNMAFSGCTKLAKATVYADKAKFGSGVFANTASGFTVYAAPGSTAETYAKAQGHTFAHVCVYGEWSVTTAATCTTAGVRTRTCTAANCSEKQTEAIPALGHTAGAAATCTTAQLCTVCGAEVAPAAGHTYGEWTVTKEATCTETGSRTHKCTVCGEEVTETIEKAAHTPGEAATCKTAQICTVCNEEIAPIDPAAHKYGEWTETKPTCTEDGSRTRTCEICGGSQTETNKALGHTPGEAATCKTAQICTVCKEEINPIDPEAHTYGDWVVDKEPLCYENGSRTRTCSGCTSTQTETIMMIGHHTEGPAATCKEAQICTVCKVELAPKTEHVYGDWTVTTAPTCTVAGIKTRTCTSCSDQQAEPVDALGHTEGPAATCTAAQICTVCKEELVAILPHTFTSIKIEEAHPHKIFNICGECGAEIDSGLTFEGDSCDKCQNLFSLYAANMTLGGSLAMNFYIPQDEIFGTEYYAEITKNGTVVKQVPFASWSNYNYGTEALYRVTLDGIPAKGMADEITVQVFKTDGTPASLVWEDSIKAYITRNLDKWSDEYKTWGVDALNYGAASQVEFNYNVANLANADLTGEQLAYATKDITLANNRMTTEKYAASSLRLASDISMTMYFKDITNTEGMYATVSFVDHNGQAKSMRVEASSFTKNGSLYGVFVNNMVTADASQIITVTMHNANGTLYAVARDSVESYCARMVGPLYIPVMMFARSTYNIFH